MPSDLMFAPGPNLDQQVGCVAIRIDIGLQNNGLRCFFIQGLVDAKRQRSIGQIANNACAIALRDPVMFEHLREGVGDLLAMSNDDQAAGGPIQTVNQESWAAGLQIQFRPTIDRTMIAPFAALGKHAAGLVPDAVVAFIRYQLSSRCSLTLDGTVEVQMEFVARSQWLLRTADAVGTDIGFQPDRPIAHGFFQSLSAQATVFRQQLDGCDTAGFGSDMLFESFRHQISEDPPRHRRGQSWGNVTDTPATVISPCSNLSLYCC